MSIRENRKKQITVTIDGQLCQAEFGQTILEIARANGLYIPTMCYLTKVMPIASCRMCVVNVEGVDGMILSCQERAVDGAIIHTHNEDLYKERQNIMKLYGVNHPLECGVCDKSGECDLQNKTLEFGVAEQPFAAKDQHRPIQNWGFISYDPSLCIMCEKCVRVSNEITGNGTLQIRSGGYHSTIVNTEMDPLDMSLGESAAVCPVGALVVSDFKYSTNAWELEKIPASCSHCSAGCKLYYEVKQDSIYRVTNEYEYETICGRGRFDFDFSNKDVSKDEKAFADVIEKFSEAKSIYFDSKITNEEALILQKLKERHGMRLINPEALAYQQFLKAYSSITGKHLYNGTLEDIKNARAVLILGSRIYDDNPQVHYHITMASRHHRARVIYMHSLEDVNLQNNVTQFIKYEVGSEEGVAALLVETLLSKTDLPETIREILDDLDIGNLSAESNVGEEELEDLAKSLERKTALTLVVGSDLYTHPRAENIAKLLALLERYADFSVMLVPPATNTLGVALICELDEVPMGTSIGYNVQADTILSALGGGDLDMPALNQQEGTFTTLDKRVVPTHAALNYEGYTLKDVANVLGIVANYTISYTAELPVAQGYQAIHFDALADGFDLSGMSYRGYVLHTHATDVSIDIEEVEELEGYDGVVVYHCDTQASLASILRPVEEESTAQYPTLTGSNQFAMVAKLKDSEVIEFISNGMTYRRVFKIDRSMKGTIALNPVFDRGLSAGLISSYRFDRVTFQRVES